MIKPILIAATASLLIGGVALATRNHDVPACHIGNDTVITQNPHCASPSPSISPTPEASPSPSVSPTASPSPTPVQTATPAPQAPQTTSPQLELPKTLPSVGADGK
jgi:hypothetical protein